MSVAQRDKTAAADEVTRFEGAWEMPRIDQHTRIKTGAKDTQDKIKDGLYPFYVRSQTVERINSYSHDCEAVLTAGDGVGTGKIFHYTCEKFEVHQRVYVIKDFSAELDGKYFFYQFSSRFYDRIMSMTAKSSVDSVRLEVIAGMPLPLPPLPEQRAIAGALSDVDSLLQSLERLIAKKRDVKQGAMQQLLTGKTRLPGFEGAWEMKRLGDLGQTFGGLTGKSKDDFGYGKGRYVTFLNAIENVRLRAALLEPVNISAKERQHTVRPGDLIFNGTSETPGELAMGAIVPDGFPLAYLNSFCFGFRRYQEENLDSQFVAYIFRGAPGRSLLAALAQGATRYNLSKSQFLRLELLLPPLPEQRAIAAVLSDMDAEIGAIEERRAKVSSIKQGMMQELLTGRTRLPIPKEANA